MSGRNWLELILALIVVSFALGFLRAVLRDYGIWKR